MQALVDYSSGESSANSVEEEANCNAAASHQPPIPDSGASTAPRGQKRCFDHVEGQWAATVMILVDLREQLNALKRLKTACSQLVGDTAELCNTPTEIAAPDMKKPKKATAPADFHISLSHTHPTSFTQRKTLLKGLRKAFENWRPLNLKLDSVQVFVNEPRSRTFLAAILCKTAASSKAVTTAFPKVDKVIAHHHMRPFFSNPVPHVSIMWWAGDQEAVLQNKLPKIQQLWAQTLGTVACSVRCRKRVAEYAVQASDVLLKFGQEQHSLSRW